MNVDPTDFEMISDPADYEVISNPKDLEVISDPTDFELLSDLKDFEVISADLEISLKECEIVDTEFDDFEKIGLEDM